MLTWSRDIAKRKSISSSERICRYSWYNTASVQIRLSRCIGNNLTPAVVMCTRGKLETSGRTARPRPDFSNEQNTLDLSRHVTPTTVNANTETVGGGGTIYDPADPHVMGSPCSLTITVPEITRRKILWDSTNPRESVFVANTWQHLPHLLFCGPLVPNFPTELFRKQSPVYGVFWPLLPHPSTDRNETRTWSSITPWLSWSQTDTQTRTDTQTNAGENIFPRFRGDNKVLNSLRNHGHNYLLPQIKSTLLRTVSLIGVSFVICSVLRVLQLVFSLHFNYVLTVFRSAFVF